MRIVLQLVDTLTARLNRIPHNSHRQQQPPPQLDLDLNANDLRFMLSN